MKKLIFIMLALCLMGAACEEKKPDIPAGLTNTKWKLAGIVDAETGVLTELEPKNCEECYTLAFGTDSSFLTSSPSNDLGGGYIVDYETYNFQVIYFGGTKVGEVGDGELYSNFFGHGYIQSFYLQRNELMLYYNDKKNYLLFKSQQP